MSKQIGVLSKNKEYFPTTQLLNAINQHNDVSGVFITTQYVFPGINSSAADALFANQSLKALIGVIPRIGRTQTDLGLLILKNFELMHLPSTLTSEALYLSRDKFRCFQVLSTIPGIRLPKTLLVNNAYQLAELLNTFKFPIVIKIPDSTRGTGTILAPNPKIAEDIIETLFVRSPLPILIQELLKNEQKGKKITPADIRVLYVGNQIIGSMKRIASKGEWKTNYAQGAVCEQYKLKPENEELIHQIVNRLGIEIAGIDLFPTQEDLFVLEVNACPGWKAFEMVHPKINVAQLIVDHLMTKIRH
ncbi:MAG: RimK family alpha-L-glutamate ligase [Candidatus Heimdallarchaeota archaeon]|nr:RimK family alpha-L-glutamate ligase [Candidatus Heimdallarchaeota archaeon]